MKFHGLMKEHENDLARIIVSPCIFIVYSSSKYVYILEQTLENGKTLAEAKVGTNRRPEVTFHTITIIRANMHTVPPSSR
jgi:hypothetical protein